MKRKNFIFVFAAVMAFGFMSCNNDGKDIVVKETDYTEVFLNAFEEKLSLLFQTAERDLRRGNHDFELLFKNAYLEVLGNYADISTFENAFLEASDRTSHAVQTRSSIEETVFMNLMYRVIDSSETKKDAIGKFDALANDVYLDLEDRIGFIGMREFLVFYENNEELIILAILEEIYDDFDEILIDERITWGCVTGVLGSRIRGQLSGCAGIGVVGGLIGSPGGPKGIAGGAAIGCLAGAIGGGVYGTLMGINEFCLERIIKPNPEDEIGRKPELVVGGVAP